MYSSLATQFGRAPPSPWIIPSSSHSPSLSPVSKLFVVGVDGAAPLLHTPSHSFDVGVESSPSTLEDGSWKRSSWTIYLSENDH